jgi:hypothetical protein
LTPERRKEIAQKANKAKIAKAKQKKLQAGALPEAKHKGFLNIMEMDLPCYVLDNGQRVIGRVAATELLTEIKGGGSFEKTIAVQSLKPFINTDLVLERLVEFRLPEVEGTGNQVKGLPADVYIDICRGFVSALELNVQLDSWASRRAESRMPLASLQPELPEGFVRMTDRQKEMAVQASLFLSACAKVGLDALIDEATGYQYERAEDALQVKLRAYLEEEMRAWERTFPDELWEQFGRLTNWKGSVSQRPKYWGKLVMELIYDYLDKDVADWLRQNAPAPRKGQNYHQWLSAQFGLQKLIEHIWKVIGVASTCENMSELRRKMAELYGKQPIQLMLFLPSDGK